MKERDFHLHDGKVGAAITVRVAPGSKRNEISEIFDDGTIKVSLEAATNDEKGNQALINFLSKVLGVKPAQLEIVAGLMGNDKLITITDLDKASVQERILKSLA